MDETLEFYISSSHPWLKLDYLFASDSSSIMTSEDSVLPSYFEVTYPLRLCVLSAAALVTYDYLLTLGTERSVFWGRRLKVSSVLYFVQRYVQLLSCIVGVVLLFPVGAQACSVLTILDQISTLLPYFAWAVFTTVRVYALSGHNLSLTVLVFVLHAPYMLPTLYTFAGSHAVNFPAPYDCIQFVPGPDSVSKALLWVVGATVLVGETIVLAVTVTKTYGWISMFAAARDVTRRRSLLEVLLTDGALCFSIPLALNIGSFALTMVSYNTSNRYEGLMIAELCLTRLRDGVISIVLSRFLLDLAAFREDVWRSDALVMSPSRPSSTLCFAVAEQESGAIARDE